MGFVLGGVLGGLLAGLGGFLGGAAVGLALGVVILPELMKPVRDPSREKTADIHCKTLGRSAQVKVLVDEHGNAREIIGCDVFTPNEWVPCEKNCHADVACKVAPDETANAA